MLHFKNVDVLLILNLEKIKLNKILHMIELMPRKRILRFNKMIENKKIYCLVGFLLVLYGLKLRYGKFFNFEFDEFCGKPFVKNVKNVFFNLSHCNDAVACGFSNFDVGVDLEPQNRKINLNLAEKICSASELNVFKNLKTVEEKRKFLIQIWTSKESFSKLKTQSVFLNLKKIDCHLINYLKIVKIQNLILSVCCFENFNLNIKLIKFEKLIEFFKNY